MSRTHLAAALLALQAATGLKEQDFRKCSDTPFCQLHRKAPEHGFQVEVSSVAYADGVLTARLHSAESPLPLGSGATMPFVSGKVHARHEPSVAHTFEYTSSVNWPAPSGPRIKDQM